MMLGRCVLQHCRSVNMVVFVWFNKGLHLKRRFSTNFDVMCCTVCKYTVYSKQIVP